MKKILVSTLLILIALTFSGCQKTLGSTEKGMRYWNLPTAIGGGLSGTLFGNSETVFEIPLFSEIYTFDTGEHVIVLGPEESNSRDISQYIKTRALDGNEVALAFTIGYRFNPDEEEFARAVYSVGTEQENVRQLVEAAARADIRTYMNEIKTTDFIRGQARYDAVDVVRKALETRLSQYGIEITQVNLDDFKFWRVATAETDAPIDTSYEDILKEIQQKQEDIKRERARYDTLENQKARELTEAEAEKQRMIEEAKGFLAQQISRGEAYKQSKTNEAEAILVSGKREVEAVRLMVKALSGPGGKALLRLRIAEELAKAAPKFVVLDGDKSGSGDLELKRTDVNRLLEQLALVEAAKETPAETGGTSGVSVPTSSAVEGNQ